MTSLTEQTLARLNAGVSVAARLVRASKWPVIVVPRAYSG
jgi:nucleotide-binding universal stress UspA family protein